MAVAARVVLSRYSVFALTLLYIVVGFISELQTSVNDATTTSYIGTKGGQAPYLVYSAQTNRPASADDAASPPCIGHGTLARPCPRTPTQEHGRANARACAHPCARACAHTLRRLSARLAAPFDAVATCCTLLQHVALCFAAACRGGSGGDGVQAGSCSSCR